MTGFNLLKRDKKLFLTNNLFSVPCVISNGAEAEETRCVGNFIGIQTMTNGGNNQIALMNDSSEACVNYDDITIGRIKENWTLSFMQGGTNETIAFRIDNVMEDRTMGVYRLKLSLLKREKAENDNTSQTTLKPIIKRNGGL
jgi:hypothetical protein